MDYIADTCYACNCTTGIPISIEVIGIIAGIFALSGFLFSKERPLRMLSSAAAILFVVYGFLIGSYTVWILNAIILCIHAYKLTKLHFKARKEKAS